MTDTPLRLGIAGLGTVGAGVVRIAQTHKRLIATRAGRPMTISAVSARDRSRDRGVSLDAYAWDDDPVALARRDDVDVVVELMGGADGPAKACVEAALAAGKDVVTANKALLAHARPGAGRNRRSRRHGDPLRGGGGRRHPGDQGADRGAGRQRDHPRDGGDERHLQLHPDPDAGRRPVLCRGLRGGPQSWAISRPTRSSTSAASTPGTSWRCWPPSPLAPRSTLPAVEIEGIERITIEDIVQAADMGYRIKLLGVAQMTGRGLEQRMSPCLVPADSPLGQLEGGTNMVVIEGDAVGQIVLRGAGAGRRADRQRGDGRCHRPGPRHPRADLRPARRGAVEGHRRARQRPGALLPADEADRQAGRAGQGRHRAGRGRGLDRPDAAIRPRRHRRAGADRHPQDRPRGAGCGPSPGFGATGVVQGAPVALRIERSDPGRAGSRESRRHFPGKCASAGLKARHGPPEIPARRRRALLLEHLSEDDWHTA